MRKICDETIKGERSANLQRLSMFPVLVTRPELSAQQTVKMFQEAGFETLTEPLLEITMATTFSKDLKKYQALVATSAIGIQVLAKLSKQREIPLWCVGKASCDAAKALGYKKVYSSNTAENAYHLFLTMKETLNPKDGAIFYGAGDITRINLFKLFTQAGFQVDTEILYQSRMRKEFSLEAREFLKNRLEGAITFYSLRTVEAFLAICEKERIQFAFNRFIALSLSDVISTEVEKLPWLQVITASTTAQLIVSLKRVVA